MNKDNTVKYVNIDWKPDKSLKVPLYSQIVRYFSRKIESGDWVSGQFIPPQRKLAELFEVNRSTIWEAMQELAALGLTEGNYGKGTMIVNDAWEMLIAGSTLNWQSYIDKGNFRANVDYIRQINQLEYEEDIVRLGTGELSPKLAPRDALAQILTEAMDVELELNYPPPLGLPRLQQALCRYLEDEKGIKVKPSNILITSGALQALQLISVCIVPPNSVAFIESPSYIKSLNVFQSAGTVLESIPMDENGMMPWIISKRFDVGRAILYTIPTLQNPTGNVMSTERRDEILRYCRANRIPIIEDDVMGDLWFDERPPKPIKALDDYGSVIYIGSCSKAFSSGMRIGWVVGPESVIQRLADIKMQQDYGTSTLSQQVFARCLETGVYEEHLMKVRPALKRRRDLTLRILEKHFSDIAQWNEPAGSYYIWLRLNGSPSIRRIFEAALAEKILVNPGKMYDIRENYSLRISYVYEDEDVLERALIRLAEIIRETRG